MFLVVGGVVHGLAGHRVDGEEGLVEVDLGFEEPVPASVVGSFIRIGLGIEEGEPSSYDDIPQVEEGICGRVHPAHVPRMAR
jgi:hypothetical protein